MNISTKGRYGLRILADLGVHQKEGRPRLIREIANSQSISEKYISRLIIELRKAGFINSVRGAKGGCMLAKSPKEITILDILRAMEGNSSIVKCVACPEGCARSKTCPTREIWVLLNSSINDSMSKVTLQDVIDKAPHDFTAAETCP